MILYPRHFVSYARSLFGRIFLSLWHSPSPVTGTPKNGPLFPAREFEVPTRTYFKPAKHSRLMQTLFWTIVGAGSVATMVFYFKMIFEHTIR